MYDIQKLKKSNYEQGVVEMFIRESDVSKVVPLMDVDTMQVTTRRMSSLPAVTWRQRGQRFSDGGQPGFEVVTDTLYNLGAEINIDEADLKDKGPFIENPVAWNTKYKTKAMVYEFQDKFLNGDHASDANAFEGLKVRIGNLASSQTIYGDGSTTAATVDIRPATVTTALAYQFLNAVEAAKYACDGHSADVCFTDALNIRYMKNALRIIGQYVNQPATPNSGINDRKTSNDVGSNNVFEWDGVKYIDMGVKADQATKIIADETVNAVTTCKPMYFVKLGGDYLSVIQNGALDVKEPVDTGDRVTFRGALSWYVGLRHVHNRFGVKLTGIRVS